MNNIRGANVVILKRPTEEEIEKDPKNYLYPITTVTRSQNSAPPKVPRTRNSQPTSRVTKPVERNLEKSVTNKALRNLDQLNERTNRSSSLFPPPPEDKEIEDSATIRGDNYKMRGTLFPGQDKQVQFENQDDGVHERPAPRHYQRKTPPAPKSPEAVRNQDNRAVVKETISIKMAEGKDCFQVGEYLDSPVTLPMWQLLDQSPQLRV